jgi:hypothetical protein
MTRLLYLAAVAVLVALSGCGNAHSPSAPSDPFATQGTGSWRPVAAAPASVRPVLPQMFFTGSEVLLASRGLVAYDPVKDSWSDLNATGPDFARDGSEIVWTGQSLIAFGGPGCPANVCVPPVAAAYDPATNQFATISTQGAPASRAYAVALWSGSKMLVWGGEVLPSDPSIDHINYNDGGLYDPVTDTWTTISAATAPPPREGHSAVWTGTEMIIWGGQLEVAGPVAAVPSGTIPPSMPPLPPALVGMAYKPDTDTWSPISTKGQPSARSGHAAVWTGTEMIVWGGGALPNPNNVGEALTDGAAYNPTTDAWRPIRSAPNTGLYVPKSVWTGAEMLVWGGFNEQDYTNQGYRYDPANDSWQYITTVGAPTPRAFSGAVWTGQSLMIWGGSGGLVQFGDGALWSPNVSDAAP